MKNLMMLTEASCLLDRPWPTRCQRADRDQASR
jgi:hypothetical protein